MEKNCKDLFGLIELFIKKDVKSFNKELAGQKKVLQGYGINGHQAFQKKQYMALCSGEIPELNTFKNGEVEIPFDKFASLLSIEQTDIEEWVIEAMADEILECKIDQVSGVIRINSTRLVGESKEECLAVKAKVQTWKSEFNQIVQILQQTPAQ